MAESSRGPGRSSRAEVDPAFLDEQYRAMEKSLREYLQTLLASRGGAVRGSAASGPTRPGGWAQWRPEIYLVVALAAALWAGLRGGGGGGDAAAEAAAISVPVWLLVVAVMAALAVGGGIAYWLTRQRPTGGPLGGARWERAIGPPSRGPEPDEAASETSPDEAGPPVEAEDDREPVVPRRGASAMDADEVFPGWAIWGAVGLALLLVVILVLWRLDLLGGGELRPMPAASTTTTTAPPPPGTPPAEGELVEDHEPVPKDPDATWERLVTEQRDELTAWVGALAAEHGLEDDQLSASQANRFGDFAETLRQGESVDDTTNLRRGLLEYIYALWEAERKGMNRQARVTLGFTGFDQDTFTGLLRQLELAPHLTPPYDPTDPALQVAVIHRWMARRDPPAAEPAPR